MSIINTSIQLGVDELLGGVTRVFAETRLVDQLNVAQWRRNLLSITEKGLIANGSGFLYNYVIKDQTTKSLLLDDYKTNGYADAEFPSAKTKAFALDQDKSCTVTVNRLYHKQDFLDGTIGEAMISQFWQTALRTIDRDVSDIAINLIKSDNNIKVVNVQQLTASTDNVDTLAMEQLNAKAFFKVFEKTLGEAAVYNDTFTSTGVYSEVDPTELVLIGNKKYITNYNIDLLANLITPSYATDMGITRVSQQVILPESVFDKIDSKAICYLVSANRYNVAYGYREVIQEIVAKNRNINNVHHYQIGTGVVEDFFGCKFVSTV